MLNTEHAFQRLDLSTNCTARAVQVVGERINDSINPIKTASLMIHSLIGRDKTFTTALQAQITAQKIVVLAIEAKHNIADIDDLINDADVYTEKYITDPKNAWLWAKIETTMPTTDIAVVEGIDTTVAVKTDGTIKKGGKQILTQELYKKYVLEATVPLSQQAMVEMIIKELGMSKAGATTYVYNAKKLLGEPTGGIAKMKKGRKAKEVA